MSNFWLVLTFCTAVTTNIIVFFGTLTLVYWVGDIKSNFITRYHDQIQYGICLTFLFYVYALLKIDAHFQTQVYGMHYTFYNVLVCASFVFCLLMISRSFSLMTAIGAVGVVLGTHGDFFTVQHVVALILLGGVQYYLAVRGRYIWDKRPRVYALMALYGAIAIFGIFDFWVFAHDFGFWFRELTALILEGVLFYEYARLLINRHRLADAYRQEAARDRMTGLKNFGTFNTEIEVLYNQFKANGSEYALYEFDVDHFKHINDTYGHLVGNDVLIRVAQTALSVAKTLPYETSVYRMGGEEFCVLVYGFRDYDEQRGRRVAEQLKVALDALNFNTPDGSFGITVSIGQDYITKDDRNYLDLYNRVDQYLYAAKTSGRDVINMHGTTLRA